jgi:preprotein translocase subunit Sec61beta
MSWFSKLFSILRYGSESDPKSISISPFGVIIFALFLSAFIYASASLGPIASIVKSIIK